MSVVLVPRLRDRLPRTAARVLCLVSLASSLYLVGTFSLVMTFWRGEDPPAGWPRGFPFPDRPVLGLAKWLDASNPASPGTIKIHGELPNVLFIVGLLTILSMLASGTLLGLLLRLRSAKNEA